MKTSELRLYATCPLGAETLLAAELETLGATQVRRAAAGVYFRGDLATAYAACLWSRVAGRILLEIGQCGAGDGDTLYRNALDLPWEEHLDADTTLAVSASTREAAIGHSHYAALKLKDAVVDRIRAASGRRPSVDTRNPGLRIHLHLQGRLARISLDLSGASLHRRGYRTQGGRAPLKENLAASLLLTCGWPQLAESGGAFLDPMCGSGTLAIEAAMIAVDMAPGLLRPGFGFQSWRGHRDAVWQEILARAHARRAAGRGRRPTILALDIDPEAVRATQDNLETAGLAAEVRVRRQELASVSGAPAASGLLLTNPPYGHRIESGTDHPRLYRTLGHKVRQHFGGWRIGVLTGEPDLLHRMKLGKGRETSWYNGAIACRLAQFRPRPTQAETGQPGADAATPAVAVAAGPAAAPSAVADNATMFANRLRKNLRHWGRWARRQGLDCYRVYDQDLPEFALSIDVYTAGRPHLLVQEYRAPAKVDPNLAAARLEAAARACAEVFEIPAESVHLKTRERQRGQSQYEKTAHKGELLTVTEGGHRFLVNLTDYLDSGLFLDHRLTRARLQAEALGKRFLNLFAYTGSATVYAAAGGARSTTTVDLSANYLDWCRRNMALNELDGPAHERIQADCLDWLREAARQNRRYDLVFLDPPTFSNSKRMLGTLDVQRDHAELLDRVAAVLAPGGHLYFSTNARRFRLDPGLQQRWQIEDLSRATLPEDFGRHPGIHQCWRLTRANP